MPERVNLDLTTRPGGGMRVVLDLNEQEVCKLSRRAMDDLTDGLAAIARAIADSYERGSDCACAPNTVSIECPVHGAATLAHLLDAMSRATPETPDTNARAGRIGMPATLKLERFGDMLYRAFGTEAYLVGSTLMGSPVARDVDVRLILDDDAYDALFGRLREPPHSDPRWAAMCEAFSLLGQSITGLPIDFQVQRRTEANRDHGRPRGALGISYRVEDDDV